MPKKISDKAIAKVPAFADRVSLFSSKLQISRYAAGTITDYCHALYKAVHQVGKLPEEFTQAVLDDYLQSMLIGICPNCKCSMITVEIIAPTRAPPVKFTNSPMAHL
jgi:hypothetical protein